MSLRWKFLVTPIAGIVAMVALGVLFLANLGTVGQLGSTMYGSRLVPLALLGEFDAGMKTQLYVVEQGIAQIGDAKAQSDLDAKMDEARSEIGDSLTTVGALGLPDVARTALQTIQAAYPGYQASMDLARERTKVGDAAGASTAYAAALAAYDPIDVAFDDLRTRVVDESKALADQITSTTATSQTSTMVLILIIAMGALVVSLLIARGISRAMGQLTLAAERLSEGNVDVTVTAQGRDEVGRMATSFRRTVEYLQTAAASAGRLAAGDLTVRHEPSSPGDMLGLALAEVTENFAATITEVQEAADSVSRTSEQLNDAAAQTGAATQQVATTISQVAGGTAEQARAASDTNAAVEELSAVIATVGQGAAETSASVTRSLDAVGRMQSAMTASDRAAEELKPANERAASALAKVTAAIQENAAGMARIKSAVDDSAVKVAELGAKGEQIGAIVETIDDIAEQTNLLALNAAIEAARAGEMGKGFAVVADEVRKLAERSGRATKEIASLIAEVQRGTSDAVAAMAAGAGEVAQGLAIGRRQSESVVEVGDAARVRDAAVERVFNALAQIEGAAAMVTAASDDIARVVDQTASGVTAMEASSGAVSRSIGSIAAVSEENSAAAEEVSAATEEMSAQAEEVVASAATLADMASQLDALVARFTLQHHAASPAGHPLATVVQRRRQDDWQRKAS